MYSNKDIANKLNLELPDFNIIGVVTNSPVYKFEEIGKGVMSNSGLKRMIGPRYNDYEHLKSISPSTYINELKYPLFLSTCKNDFIRNETMSLLEDVKDRKGFMFVDINSDDKEIDHVHNVSKPWLKESKEVNDRIIDFLGKL